MRIPIVMLRMLSGVLALCLALPCQALAGTDYSDQWWNPSESGWGAGIQRQGDVIFLTLFVYAADGSGTWFVAPDVTLQGPEGAGSSWSGTLYRTTGPGFAAVYDGNVQPTVVGIAALEFASATSGTLSYVVNGVQVTKQISRMLWREPSPAGRYFGGFSAQVVQCNDPTRIGGYEFLGAMNVTQGTGRVTVAITTVSEGVPSTCNFSGATHQDGRYGSVDGTFACTIVLGGNDRGEATATTNRRGSFTLRRMTYSQNGFHGELAAADQDCAFTGYVGGTRLP